MKSASTKKAGRTRNTKQRRMILDLLRSAPPHTTAAWIHQEVRKKIPTISLGTVYRNLNILKEQGDVEELACKGEFSLAALEDRGMYYVTCRSCRRVVEAELPIASNLDREVERATGYRIRSHCMAFYGLCPDCRSHETLPGNTRRDDGG